MINYKQTYDTMYTARSELESRIWHMITLQDEHDTADGDDCSNLVNGELPESYKGDWELIICPRTDNHLTCNFHRTEQYGDFTEHKQVNFTWEELQYDDTAVMLMWRERGDVMLKKQEADELRNLQRMAEVCGYRLATKLTEGISLRKVTQTL